MRLRSSRSAPRRGISLLESIIAGAILFIMLAGINSLLDTAGKHAIAVKERSLAIQVAQSKLNEVACGALGLGGQGGEVEGMQGWEYSIEATQFDVSGLWKVVVKVKRTENDGSPDAAVLESIILDPSKRGSPLDTTTVATGGDTTANDKADTPTIPSAGGSGGMGSTGTQPQTVPLPMGGGGGGGASGGKAGGAGPGG